MQLNLDPVCRTVVNTARSDFDRGSQKVMVRGVEDEQERKSKGEFEDRAGNKQALSPFALQPLVERARLEKGSIGCRSEMRRETEVKRMS